MIVGMKIQEQGGLLERITYSLIEGKLVITSDIRDAETNEVRDHAVIPVNCDIPLTAEQVCEWISGGAV